MLKLKPDEQAMLDGKEGELTQRAMAFLVELGEVFGAEDMVDIDFAYTSDIAVMFADLEKGTKLYGIDADLIQREIEAGLKYKAPSVGGLGLVDEENLEALKATEEEANISRKMMKNEEKLGIIRCGSCTPYMCIDTNKVLYKKSVASAESSAIPYWNGVLGARCNRGLIATCFAALTGKYPRILYHCDEYRYANTVVDVKVELKNLTDFGCLGLYVGKICDKNVPVFRGITDADNPELIALGASLATGGAVSLFHIPGITREFATEAEALNGKEPVRVIEFGEKELRSIYDKYPGEPNEPVNRVFLGCPHATVFQLQSITEQFIQNHITKLPEGLDFVINIAEPTRKIARHMGMEKVLKDAGVTLLAGTCQIIGYGIPSPLYCYSHPEYTTGTVVTDSLKVAAYAKSALNAKKVILGSTAECIRAGMTGKWGV